MTNSLANQNRHPRPDPYRFFACVSWAWAWPVQGSKEVAGAPTAGPVSPGFSLDTESPVGELVLLPVLGVQQEPTTPAMPFASPTSKMAHILYGIVEDGPVLSSDPARPTHITKRQVERCIHELSPHG